MSFLSFVSALNVTTKRPADGKCECFDCSEGSESMEKTHTHTHGTTQQTITSKHKNKLKTKKRVAFEKPWKTIATVYVLVFHIQRVFLVMAFGSLVLCVVWFSCVRAAGWVGDDVYESVCTDLPSWCWWAWRPCHLVSALFLWHIVNLHLILIVVRCSAIMLVTFLSTLNMKCRVVQFQIGISFLLVSCRKETAWHLLHGWNEQSSRRWRSIGRRFHHLCPPLRSGLVVYVVYIS